MPNRYLPINVSMKTHPILVVGGGNVALRKIENLMDFETDITVVAPDVLDRIEYYASKNMLKLERRPYQSPEAAKYGLVVSASDDEALNRQVYNDCADANVLVNVVDNPPLCTFIFPAMLKRDALSVAVSTDGKAPFLAAHLRLILENVFPDHWKKIVDLAGMYRKRVQEKFPGDEHIKPRFAALDRFLQADWKTLIKGKNDEQLWAELDRLIETEDEPEEAPDQTSQN